MSFYHVKESTPGDARYYDNDGNEYWEVEKIINKKIDPLDGVLKYEVKWLGYGEEDNTWEPLENLEHVKKMVNDFEKSFGKARVPAAAAKNIPNKTPQSGKEASTKKDLKDVQPKAAQQLKNLGESVLGQNKKPENENSKETDVKGDIKGNFKPKASNSDEPAKIPQMNEILQKVNMKSLESKPLLQPPPSIISKEKEIIKNGPDKNTNLKVVNQNEQNKASSGLAKAPAQSKENHLKSQDKILRNVESEFDIISRTTGVSAANRDQKGLSRNSSMLGEIFNPKKAAPKELDAMVIEDDDDDNDKEIKAIANENIKRANSTPGGELQTTITPLLKTESQPAQKKKSRFQDASEVLGGEKLLDVPKVLLRTESDKPTEKDGPMMNIEERPIKRTVSSNAEIPSQFTPQILFKEKEKPLQEPEKLIEGQLRSTSTEIIRPQRTQNLNDPSVEEPHFNTDFPSRLSRNQITPEISSNNRDRGSEKSREKEDDRERERDLSEDKRSNMVRKRMKKRFYSKLHPPKVEEEESNQNAYYETIKQSYLKHEMDKNEFLEFLCPYGNFKDDEMERISNVFWEGKASTGSNDYCFEIIWKARSNGIHKAPTVVSWEDLLDGNPREAAKFSFSKLAKIFSNFGTLEE